MGTYTLSAAISRPYDEVLEATRAALSAQGFGILTEIDLAGTMKAKLDVDLPPQVILGACRPTLAYEAIQVDPSIAAVLPCNVVVRSVNDTITVVEAFDPDAMTGLAGEALHRVATDARQRLVAVLAEVGSGRTSRPGGTSGSGSPEQTVPSVSSGRPRP
jgi:uncharacterized protein (DUF302 family)